MKNFLCIALLCVSCSLSAAQKDDWHERLVQLNDNPKNKKRLASFKRKSVDGTRAQAEKKIVEIKEPEPMRSDNLRRSGSLK